MQSFGRQTRCIMGDEQIANGQFWNWLVHKEVFTVFKLLVCSWHHKSRKFFEKKLFYCLTPNMPPCHMVASQEYVALSHGWKFLKKGALNGVWVRKCMHVQGCFLSQNNHLKFHSPNGSWNYISQFQNITCGIYAKYHYKSCYFLYKLCYAIVIVRNNVIGGK